MITNIEINIKDRLQNYNSKKKGHIYEMPYFSVSWSKDLNGVNNLSNYIGEVLLILAKTNISTDTIGLLDFY